MFEIPHDRLPPGFADTLDAPPDNPVTPRPAATTVLLRDAAVGVEVLLMRRHRGSGFVPGAWVFPGGRVDVADSAPPLYERLDGLPSDPVPEAAFWVAGLRELFEETGVLLAMDGGGEWLPDASSSARIEGLRRSLMEDEVSLMDVLNELEATLDAASMVHIAHWVTPVVEPRRYDTHFFAVGLPPGRDITADPREMTESLWVTPGDALDRFERGDLHMVFPTVKTLQMLDGYDSADHVVASFRHRTVRRVLPRLVRTQTGVAIVVEDDPAEPPDAAEP